MKHLYLFTLEITPLEVGKVYHELPSHLTLMSRFLCELPAEELAHKVQPFFTQTPPINLVFDQTIELGPKKVTAHMVDSSGEMQLHRSLHQLLGSLKVKHQYREFTGDNHKPHVTTREEIYLGPGSERTALAAYLIEVVDKKRVVRAKFYLSETLRNQRC